MTVYAIGQRRTNAELMADCATLGYLPEPVLDLTYGLGRFWTDYRPKVLVTNDLNPTRGDHHVDWAHDNAPEWWWNGAFGAVVFDPPYKLNGTSTGKGCSASDADYGVAGEYESVAVKMAHMKEGLFFAGSLGPKFILMKCQDQVVSGNVVWQTQEFQPVAAVLGYRLVDMLHVVGSRAQPPGRRQLHARRDYSTLLVFRKS